MTGDNAVGLLMAGGLSLLLTIRSAWALLGLPLLIGAFVVAVYLDWKASR